MNNKNLDSSNPSIDSYLDRVCLAYKHATEREARLNEKIQILCHSLWNRRIELHGNVYADPKHEIRKGELIGYDFTQVPMHFGLDDFTQSIAVRRYHPQSRQKDWREKPHYTLLMDRGKNKVYKSILYPGREPNRGEFSQDALGESAWKIAVENHWDRVEDHWIYLAEKYNFISLPELNRIRRLHTARQEKLRALQERIVTIAREHIYTLERSHRGEPDPLIGCSLPHGLVLTYTASGMKVFVPGPPLTSAELYTTSSVYAEYQCWRPDVDEYIDNLAQKTHHNPGKHDGN